MEALLTLNHPDYKLMVYCPSYDKIFKKAQTCMRVKQNDETLYSIYTWDKNAFTQINGEQLIEGKRHPSIFFENTDYQFWINFKRIDIEDAWINTPLRNIQDNFMFNQENQILFGHLNYGNDIGRAEFNIDYKLKNGEIRHSKLGYDVLSIKLDYHKDLKKIVDDIEKEYRMPSIDFLRKTYHTFDVDVVGETPDIIWWNLFKDIQTNFIQAVKTIVDCPRNRLVQKETYLRADKLKRLTPQLEIQLTEHRKNPAHLYRTEHPIACVDTMENRFLKYCIIFIAEKFSDLKCRIINSYKQLTEKYIINLNQQQEELQRLVHHPFFRTVGEFRGFTQESLILKQATGYSEIYHDWIILSCGYDLKEGANSLELKDIAKLYEIWCFIELKNIIKELLGNEVETNYSKRPEKKFITQLGKGKLSKVIFSKHNIELAKICYNPKSYVGEEQLSTIIPCTTSYTVSQQPDIILQLTRRDIKQGIKLTYLFDAKYRIGDTQDNVDTPPDDAINQMHRYRDAIYYIDQDTKQLKKEVIGGYILFPGNGEDSAVEEMNFYKSIGKVNIGAFPLRPQDNESKELLRGFLKRLIWECPTYQILEQTFTHKETMLTFNQLGSVLLVPIAKSRSYFKDFNERSKVIHYYFGKIKMGGVYEHLNFQKYDYFIPVIEGKIRDVYRIEYASVRHRNDIPGIEPKENVDLSDFRIYMKLTSPSYLTGAKRLIPIRHSRIDYKCFFKEYNSITEVINLITE